MFFNMYKPYVLLAYTKTTPKPTPYRKHCELLLSQKKVFCMIYKYFEIWEYGEMSS